MASDRILNTFVNKTPASRRLASRLRAVMPGGETRSVTFYRPYPVVLERGEGAEVIDIDGNRYLDVLNNYTALVHGHAFGPVVEAAAAALARGSVFPSPTHAQLDLAEAICDRYPAIESVRFTNSGTEASLLALRIARRATGRDRFLVFEGGYHGTAPEFADASLSRRTVPYNDLSAAEAALDGSIAAVFVEPFLGSAGVVPAERSFLVGLARATRAAGAVLVLDEVQALRNNFHGAHSVLGIEPDLMTIGKIIGGGFPVGAVGGRDRLMQLTAADQPGALRHSGTFNGNPVTAAAGLAALTHLTTDAIDRLNSRAEGLAGAIAVTCSELGLRAAVTRAGSILQVHLLNDGAPDSFSGAADLQTATAPDQALLHIALLNHGVYTAPRGMLNLSTSLTDANLDRVLEGYRGALHDVLEARSRAPHVAHVG